MPCYHPITGYRAKKPNPETGKRSIVFNTQEGYRDLVVTLPCGSCIGCRLDYSLEYAARAVHEMKSWETGCSLTLTYDDKHLPQHGTLVKRHPQLFMKSLREKISPLKIRAFGCGEYGEQKYRPHYHLCVFNYDFPDKKHVDTSPEGFKLYESAELSSLWEHGSHKIAELNFETAAYAARYMLKKIKGKNATPYYGNSHRIAPYALSPRRPGLGKDYCLKYLSEIYANDKVTVQKAGKYLQISPPKYYDKLLEKTDPVLYSVVMAKRKAEAMEHRDHPDSTAPRLKVRRIVHEAQAKLLLRKL